MTKLNTTALIAERIRYWRERSGKNLDEVVAATGLALEVVWFSDDAPLPRSITSKP